MPQPKGRIDESLGRVGLAQRANDRVKTYSLGMRQRLGIARCLLADPQLLILDEPMNGLDPAGILEMRHLIRAFVDEGRTVFLSSHLLDEVEKTCDQVAIVDRGSVILQGGVRDIAATGDPTVLIDVDDAEAARRVLATESRVSGVELEGTELRITLGDGLDPAEVNRKLVQAGIAVSRLEPARATLEEKFLAVTSRLEGTNEADLGRGAEARPPPWPDDLVAAADGRRLHRHAGHHHRAPCGRPHHYGPAGGRSNLEATPSCWPGSATWPRS